MPDPLDETPEQPAEPWDIEPQPEKKFDQEAE